MYKESNLRIYNVAAIVHKITSHGGGGLGVLQLFRIRSIAFIHVKTIRIKKSIFIIIENFAERKKKSGYREREIDGKLTRKL